MSGAAGELLRNQNSERIQLEQELSREESDALETVLKDAKEKERNSLDKLAQDLEQKLQGMLLFFFLK